MALRPAYPRTLDLVRVELVVSEVFGPTWQGEGPSLGRRAGFIRLGRCNLRCVWCDTPYTWRWEDHDPAVELSNVSIDDLLPQIEEMDVPLVVITGGEPLLQQSHLPPLVESLRQSGIDVEIETAGTIAPTADLAQRVTSFNVSPKLSNSGNAADRRYKPDVLRAFEATGRASFKFVVVAETDLGEIASMVEECGLSDVWVMPEGTQPEILLERSRELAGPVAARGWNLTSRLQVLLWKDRRGV